MTIVTVLHRTTYQSDQAVMFGPHQLFLRPRETRDLRVLEHNLHISPPATVAWSQDVSGNAIAVATFGIESHRLVIESRSLIQLCAPAWPVFPISADASQYPFRYSEDDWTDLGALTTLQYADADGLLAIWVRKFILHTPMDTLSLLQRINVAIPSCIDYEIREGEGTQPPLHTFERRRGSCRDMAVILTEAARILGLGARLVSGYMFDPQHDLTGSSGLGSTHAWAEIYVPGAGWITFDPTNRAMGSANLIPVTVARDMRQMVPVAGTFSGITDVGMTMTVMVEVREQALAEVDRFAGA